MIQVVAAILERDGRILIGQRTAVQSHALQWEFPGGKVEPGETPEQALARELDEELGIAVEAFREMTRYRFTYAGKNPIELIFFRLDSYAGTVENRIFNDLRWVEKSRLPEFDFVGGDREFLDGLYTNAYGD